MFGWSQRGVFTMWNDIHASGAKEKPKTPPRGICGLGKKVVLGHYGTSKCSWSSCEVTIPEKKS